MAYDNDPNNINKNGISNREEKIIEGKVRVFKQIMEKVDKNAAYIMKILIKTLRT